MEELLIYWQPTPERPLTTTDLGQQVNTKSKS